MERQIIINAGENKLSGTLSYLEEGKRFPAVLLIPGSGPVDRDENHKKAKLNVFFELSEYLTPSGFTVLRYDKRGVGESEGDYWSTGFYDNISDVNAALHFLKEQEEVDPESVFLLGHSEGAFISTHIAGDGGDIAGIILLAGGAHSGEETLKWQALKVVEGMKGFNKWLIDHMHIDVAKSQQKQLDKIKKTTKGSMRIQLISKLNAKWMREFMAYNPAEDMPHITVPVLAITGSKDIQVNPEDLYIMKELIPSDVEYHLLPDVSHLLRYEPEAASISNYKNMIKQPIDERIPRIIHEWLIKQTDMIPE
ncbi:MAG: alpha/beta fold hydrolase [Dehalococcoidales bacterium]|nr:alpha/beta fold hydrolase [Dehalococcoidales bacterium]